MSLLQSNRHKMFIKDTRCPCYNQIDTRCLLNKTQDVLVYNQIDTRCLLNKANINYTLSIPIIKQNTNQILLYKYKYNPYYIKQDTRCACITKFIIQIDTRCLFIKYKHIQQVLI